MREIEFRGKRTDIDEWTYGYYMKRFRESSKSVFDYILDGNIEYSCKTFPVIPETVGQFTGLKDKNGAKIFDGDIIQYGKNLYIVEYHVEIGATVCVRTNDVDHWPSFNVGTIKHTRVIGNIHDNPELLEDTNHDN